MSLIPQDQVRVLKELVSKMSLKRFLGGWRPVLPEPLSVIHSAEDTSDRLSEKSLRLMLSLLLQLIQNHTHQVIPIGTPGQKQVPQPDYQGIRF
jgi:hypothetical protein